MSNYPKKSISKRGNQEIDRDFLDRGHSGNDVNHGDGMNRPDRTISRRILLGSLLVASTGLALGLHRTLSNPQASSSLAEAEPTDRSGIQLAKGDPNRPNARSPVGVNMSELVDWTTQWAFVDAFKISRAWIAQKQGASWGQGGTLKLTPEGWIASLEPGQYAETPMFDNGSRYPAGKYTVFYDGEGKIGFNYGSGKIVSEAPGRLGVDVQPQDTGIVLQVLATNPANPIRNIRMIMPGFENTYQKQPFHPLFLERLSRFKVIRFMDWMKANGSPVKEWSDRVTPQHSSQMDDRGAALEHMIDLANTLHADPWFTLPHQASDDYVRRFATMVRDRLDPSLTVYIEYSNEVWNYAFKQTRDLEQRGLALGLAPGDGGMSMIRYYAQRSVEVFKIWEEVFGGRQRLVRVLASQMVNPWLGDKALTWKDAYKHADVYAITGYFSGKGIVEKENVDRTLKMTPDQIIDNILEEIRTENRDLLIKNAALAKQFGLKLVAYEGGLGLFSNQMGDQEPQATALFNQVNRHPRMREVYQEYLKLWRQVGGGLFNQYHYIGGFSKWGSWGALEYQNQDLKQAPKFQGLMDFIQANPSTTP